jgi:Flp pilus assembly protein TadG
MAIDYGRAMRLRSALQLAADAAVLAASKVGLSEEQRRSIASETFNANVARLEIVPGTPTITVNTSGVTIQANVELPTALMQLAGISQMPIEVRSAAQVTSPLDVYLVLDMSASMGIAADETERQLLRELTRPLIQATGDFWRDQNPNGCAFACHRRGRALPGVFSEFEPPGKTTYQLAREAGIRLREDIFTDAAGAVVETLLVPDSPSVISGALKVGVIGFSNHSEWLTRPTGDKSIARLSLSAFPQSDRWDTGLDEALTWVERETALESGGRKRAIVLVTDGVRGGWYWGMRWDAIDTSKCEAIKNDGVDLYVIETRYEEERGDYSFEETVASFYDRISPNLRECASPGKHYLASTPAEIRVAFSGVASSIGSSTLRLAQ